MKKNVYTSLITGTLFLILVLVSCSSKKEQNTDMDSGQEQSDSAFIAIMKKHLRSVESRDLESLKSTLSPEGGMQLILPDSEITHTVDEYISFHVAWFKDTAWTMETKILNTKIGDKMGMATTDAMYKEPERNGKPYFNHLIVTYVLEKIDGEWYVISDHACSIEKTKN